MSDIKKINRQFLINFISLIVIFVLAVVGILLSFLLIKNQNYAYLIVFIILLLVLILTSLFKNKLDQTINMSYLIRIRANEAPALPIRQLVNFNTAQDLFRQNGFDKYQDNETYVIYYKCEKDHIKQIFRNNILTVMILIKNKNTDFYLSRVDNEINKLRDELFKEKKKINRLIITQIKEINELDDQTRDMIKEILFIRTKRSVVSTINVGLHRPSKKALMLYSENYSPSLYYKYHIEEIKNIL